MAVFCFCPLKCKVDNLPQFKCIYLKNGANYYTLTLQLK